MPAPALVASGDAVRLLVALRAHFALFFGGDAAGMGALFALLGGLVAARARGDFPVGTKGGDETEEGEDGEYAEQFLHDILVFRCLFRVSFHKSNPRGSVKNRPGFIYAELSAW